VSPSTVLRDGLEWAGLADGQAHRLKRGKHFDGEVKAATAEAKEFARAAGRGMLAVRDEIGRKHHYLWIQFTDQELILGEPCRVCGGLSFTALHPGVAEGIGRCDTCGASALFQPPAAGTDAVRAGQRITGRQLWHYPDFELIAIDEDYPDTDVERWYGRAVDVYGTDVLLRVDYTLHNGQRIDDPAEPGGHVHSVRRWPVEMLGTAAKLGVFDDWPAAEPLRRALCDPHLGQDGANH
jgi:hypothetical protein